MPPFKPGLAGTRDIWSRIRVAFEIPQFYIEKPIIPEPSTVAVTTQKRGLHEVPWRQVSIGTAEAVSRRVGSLLDSLRGFQKPRQYNWLTNLV
jgi:hypothetical protein